MVCMVTWGSPISRNTPIFTITGWSFFITLRPVGELGAVSQNGGEKRCFKPRQARNDWQECVQKTYERPMIMIDYESIANNQMQLQVCPSRPPVTGVNCESCCQDATRHPAASSSLPQRKSVAPWSIGHTFHRHWLPLPRSQLSLAPALLTCKPTKRWRLAIRHLSSKLESHVGKQNLRPNAVISLISYECLNACWFHRQHLVQIFATGCPCEAGFCIDGWSYCRCSWKYPWLVGKLTLVRLNYSCSYNPGTNMVQH